MFPRRAALARREAAEQEVSGRGRWVVEWMG